MILLTHESIDPPAVLAAVQRPHCGAVVLFLGTVRDITGTALTAALEYEAYTQMAEKILRDIVAETQLRWPEANVAIVHRLGRVEAGEASVAVAVSTPHRAEAFDAARQAMEELKARVPIWKKDIPLVGIPQWVAPT